MAPRQPALEHLGASLLTLTRFLVLLLPASALAAPPQLYVTDGSDTVTVIDTSTNEITGKIQPPLAAGYIGVAVSPDGAKVYLADGNHRVDIVTSPTDHPTFDSVQLDESLTPINLVATPDGSSVYVANAGSNTVSVIDTTTKAVETVAILCSTNGTNSCSSVPPIAVTPDKNASEPNVYVGTLNGFAVINATAKSLKQTVLTTCGPDPCPAQSIAASGDDSTVFVSQFEIDTVLGIDVSLMNLVDDIAMVGHSPVGLVVTPDTERIYVANQNGASVSVIDVASCGPICSVSEIADGVVTEPSLVAITPDGASVYVGGTATVLSVIDTASNRVTATVTNLASVPLGMAIGVSVPGAVEPPPNGGNGGSGCSTSAAGTADFAVPLLIPVLLVLGRRVRLRSG